MWTLFRGTAVLPNCWQCFCILWLVEGGLSDLLSSKGGSRSSSPASELCFLVLIRILPLHVLSAHLIFFLRFRLTSGWKNSQLHRLVVLICSNVCLMGLLGEECCKVISQFRCGKARCLVSEALILSLLTYFGWQVGWKGLFFVLIFCFFVKLITVVHK